MDIQHIIKVLYGAGLKQKHICRLTGIEPYTISRWSSSKPPSAVNHTLKLVELYKTATRSKRAAKSLLAKAEAS